MTIQKGDIVIYNGPLPDDRKGKGKVITEIIDKAGWTPHVNVRFRDSTRICEIQNLKKITITPKDGCLF